MEDWVRLREQNFDKLLETGSHHTLFFLYSTFFHWEIILLDGDFVMRSVLANVQFIFQTWLGLTWMFALSNKTVPSLLYLSAFTPLLSWRIFGQNTDLGWQTICRCQIFVLIIFYNEASKQMTDILRGLKKVNNGLRGDENCSPRRIVSLHL